jgi:hypothetical protein
VKLGLLLGAAILACLPGQVALAQVEACLDPAVLASARQAGAAVNAEKTRFPLAPVVGGAVYIPETDGLYEEAPANLRFYARLPDGEPLFSLFGTVLGRPGSLYMLARPTPGPGGCAFARYNISDRWMITHRESGYWELIDRGSVVFRNGIFEFEMVQFGGYYGSNANPEQIYVLHHLSFKCPGQRGLNYAVHKSEDGRDLWVGDFVREDGAPYWLDSPSGRNTELQRYFCANGAGADIANIYPDVPAALAAWRTAAGNR